MNVFDLLKHIKEKPLFYLESKSLKMLRVFLVGYESGAASCGDRDSVIGQLRPFNDWTAKKLGFGNSTSGWCNMILSTAGSDENGFDLFFELLEQYRSDPD